MGVSKAPSIPFDRGWGFNPVREVASNFLSSTICLSRVAGWVGLAALLSTFHWGGLIYTRRGL